MPRRRQPPPQDEEIDWDELQVIFENQKPRMSVCSQHLTKCYFEMSKELGKPLECPVCLEDLGCSHCFSLLSCGHYLHAGCLVQLRQAKCPVCRSE